MTTLSTRAIATRLVHSDKHGTAVVPVFNNAAFVLDHMDPDEVLHQPSSSQPCYSRGDNPTVAALKARPADIEWMSWALAFSTGMSAIVTTVLTLCRYLELRVERASATAPHPAHLAAAHPATSDVNNPGLPDTVGPDIATRLTGGRYGGMFSFTLMNPSRRAAVDDAFSAHRAGNRPRRRRRPRGLRRHADVLRIFAGIEKSRRPRRGSDPSARLRFVTQNEQTDSGLAGEEPTTRSRP